MLVQRWSIWNRFQRPNWRIYDYQCFLLQTPYYSVWSSHWPSSSVWSRVSIISSRLSGDRWHHGGILYREAFSVSRHAEVFIIINAICICKECPTFQTCPLALLVWRNANRCFRNCLVNWDRARLIETKMTFYSFMLVISSSVVRHNRTHLAKNCARLWKPVCCFFVVSETTPPPSPTSPPGEICCVSGERRRHRRSLLSLDWLELGFECRSTFHSYRRYKWISHKRCHVSFLWKKLRIGANLLVEESEWILIDELNSDRGGSLTQVNSICPI